MKTRCNVLISGNVQGVFFRSTVQHLATATGVSGWVKNLPDGKVEAVLEGDRASIDHMLGFMRDGPPGAEVTNVKVSWQDYKGDLSGFQIRF